MIECVVSANGFDFRVHEEGSGDRLALCLHGFPELGYSWRHQLPLLADHGYRAWAPDLRGYGATRPRPRRRRDYRTELLLDDVAALIDAAAPRETVLIGHDWGAALAWYIAMHRIRPLDRLVIMNVPHPVPFQRELRTLSQLRKSWYFLFFQLPWLPERAIGRNDAEAIVGIFRDSAVHADRFGDDVVDRYRRAAAEPGALRAMINWYRGAVFSARRLRGMGYPMIETPTLMVWGEQDVALGTATTYGTGDSVTDLTLRYLPNASHWVQQDQPDVVNSMLEAFLRGEQVPEAGDISD